MNALTGALLAFVLYGGYLLVWPVYRILHPKRTQRRRALFILFLVEVSLHVLLGGFAAFCVLRGPHLHYVLLSLSMVYLLLGVVFWVITYGVWADSRPDAEQ